MAEAAWFIVLLSGRRQQSPFQSLYELVRVVHGLNNHGHLCGNVPKVERSVPAIKFIYRH